MIGAKNMLSKKCFTLLKVKNLETGAIRYYVEQDNGKFVRTNKSGYEYLEIITKRHDCIHSTHKNGIARFYKTCHWS